MPVRAPRRIHEFLPDFLLDFLPKFLPEPGPLPPRAATGSGGPARGTGKKVFIAA